MARFIACLSLVFLVFAHDDLDLMQTKVDSVTGSIPGEAELLDGVLASAFESMRNGMSRHEAAKKAGKATAAGIKMIAQLDGDTTDLLANEQTNVRSVVKKVMTDKEPEGDHYTLHDAGGDNVQTAPEDMVENTDGQKVKDAADDVKEDEDGDFGGKSVRGDGKEGDAPKGEEEAKAEAEEFVAVAPVDEPKTDEEATANADEPKSDEPKAASPRLTSPRLTSPRHEPEADESETDGPEADEPEAEKAEPDKKKVWEDAPEDSVERATSGWEAGSADANGAASSSYMAARGVTSEDSDATMITEASADTQLLDAVFLTAQRSVANGASLSIAARTAARTIDIALHKLANAYGDSDSHALSEKKRSLIPMTVSRIMQLHVDAPDTHTDAAMPEADLVLRDQASLDAAAEAMMQDPDRIMNPEGIEVEDENSEAKDEGETAPVKEAEGEYVDDKADVADWKSAEEEAQEQELQDELNGGDPKIGESRQ